MKFDMEKAAKDLNAAGLPLHGFSNRRPMFLRPLSDEETELVEKIVKGEEVVEPAPPVSTPKPVKPVKPAKSATATKGTTKRGKKS